MQVDGFESIKRILAVRLDNIGDVVLLSPALRALRQSFPDALITLMASPAGSQVAPLLPWVNDVLIWRAIWQDISGEIPLDAGREIDLINRLHERNFDAAFIFTSFSQSPYPPAYACYLAEIPFRIGHSKEFGGSLLSHWSTPPAEAGHQAERNLALLKSIGLPVGNPHLELFISEKIAEEADSLLEAYGVNPYSSFMVIAPGASCSARRYDPVRFANVVKLLGFQFSVPMVIVGSASENETLARFFFELKEWEAYGEQVISLVGKSSVPQLAGIISRSRMVIANNSASLHLADALGIPMVILYSGTEHESQWMPRLAPARLLRRYTSCSPCYKFQCPFHLECLDLQPDEVSQTVLDLWADTGDYRFNIHEIATSKRITASWR